MKQEKLTRSISTEEAPKKWYVIDAKDQILGRLATKVAHIIRGKNKAIYTPHSDTGDFVIVINAEQVRMTGKREIQKKYYSYTGYPGGLKERTFHELITKHPERVVEYAVQGMLPKTKLGKHLNTKLKVYSGSEHPHKAQKPEVLSM